MPPRKTIPGRQMQPMTTSTGFNGNVGGAVQPMTTSTGFNGNVGGVMQPTTTSTGFNGNVGGVMQPTTTSTGFNGNVGGVMQPTTTSTGFNGNVGGVMQPMTTNTGFNGNVGGVMQPPTISTGFNGNVSGVMQPTTTSTGFNGNVGGVMQPPTISTGFNGNVGGVMQTMTTSTGFNGNVNGNVGSVMQPMNTGTGFNGNVGGVGVGSYASSTSGMSLGQQPNMNMNVNMNPMNMLEAGHDFHQLNATEADFIRITEDGFDSNSGSENPEGGSGDDQAEPNQTPGAKRKRYHRHSQLQIQEMENFFKDCPHPDDKQRKELGRQLGLAPLQVKFWFQNKRTQVKTQHERNDNQQLRNVNERLRIDNMRLQEAINRTSCLTCGGQTVVPDISVEEQALRIENARLKEEIDRMSGVAARYMGRPFMRITNGIPTIVPHLTNPAQVNFVRQQPLLGDVYGAGDMFRTITAPNEVEKGMIIELVVEAMEELVAMAQMQEPLWVPSIDGTTALLNHHEYFTMFPRGLGLPAHGFKFEASREIAVVAMSHVNLVEILMNVDQWTIVFASLISRAMSVDVLSAGVGGSYNGAFHLMAAEFQVPTPIVPTRPSYFARYCKQHANGIWAVVDVSLEGIRPGAVMRFRRRPSGCLIQEMPNGYSKVMWVEHVEVDDRLVHQLYKPLVNSGLAFGAQRWVGTLDRHCERLASALASVQSNDLANMGIANQEGRRSLIKLAERMVISYSQGVTSSSAHTWTLLAGTGADDVRVMSKKCVDEPGRPIGVVLCATTSFWVPASPKNLLNFLRGVSTRHEWDILSNGGQIEETAHIAYGRESENCISLYRVTSTDGSRENMVMIQEIITHASGKYFIYAPVDIRVLNPVLAGGASESVSILPSGIAILPDGTGGGGGGNGDDTGGSLLTVAFQILVDSDPTAKLSLGSIATINGLITCTVDRIKSYTMVGNNAFVHGNNAQMARNNAGQDGPMI